MQDSASMMIVHKLYTHDAAGNVLSGACLKLLDRDGKVASELHGKVGSPCFGVTHPHYCQVKGEGPYTHETADGVTVEFEVVTTAVSHIAS
jgi:hypothetical protein